MLGHAGDGEPLLARQLLRGDELHPPRPPLDEVAQVGVGDRHRRREDVVGLEPEPFLLRGLEARDLRRDVNIRQQARRLLLGRLRAIPRPAGRGRAVVVDHELLAKVPPLAGERRRPADQDRVVAHARVGGRARQRRRGEDQHEQRERALHRREKRTPLQTKSGAGAAGPVGQAHDDPMVIRRVHFFLAFGDES